MSFAQGLADIARRVIGCQFLDERVFNAVVVEGDTMNVIAWMAPVPPFRLAGRASFLYKTNLELGSEHACFYQLKLSARGLAQLIARCSWEVSG